MTQHGSLARVLCYHRATAGGNAVRSRLKLALLFEERCPYVVEMPRTFRLPINKMSGCMILFTASTLSLPIRGKSVWHAVSAISVCM